MAFSFYLEFIRLSLNYKCLVSGSGSRSVHACTLDTTFRSETKMSRQNIFLYKKEYMSTIFIFSIRLEQQSGLIFFFSRMHFARVLCKEYHVIE